MTIIEDEKYEKAINFILEYTGSSKWEEIEKMDWTTSEIADMMRKFKFSEQTTLTDTSKANGSAWCIIHQNKPLKNILFKSDKEARNYIKMQNSKRKFKEPNENVFVCLRYGTTFRIVELHYR